MKLTRKLIPAFAMLLVSAVLMSTASFAWFSMNADVQADGLVVTATAPAALWIARVPDTGDDAQFTTAIKFTRADNVNAKDGNTSVAHAIDPVTMQYADGRGVEIEEDSDLVAGACMTPSVNNKGNADAWVFYNLKTQDEYSKVNEAGQHTDGIRFEDEKDDKGNTLPANVKVDSVNFFKTSFLLKLEGQKNVDTRKVLASMTVSSSAGKENSDAIYKALRAAIVVADSGKTVGGYAIYDWNALGENVDGAKEFMTIAAQEEVQIYIYVWFEGEDANCYNAAAQNFNDFTIDIQFVTGK